MPHLPGMIQSLLEEPEHQSKLLVGLGALVISVYWLTHNHTRKSSLPPGYTHLPHLPSWVPFVGSAIHFRRGHLRDFIWRSAKQLNAPAFTATVMGDKCLFIAGSDLMQFMFRDSKQLDGQTFQKRFMRNVVGFDQAQVSVLFDSNSATLKAVMNLFHKHLLKEDALQRTIRLSQEVLIKEVAQLTAPIDGGPISNDRWIRQPLYHFASRAVFRAATGPLLSMNLIPNSDDHLRNLRAFEQDLGLLIVGAPNFMAPECVRARAALFQLFMSDLVCSAETPFLKERRECLVEGFANSNEFKDNMEFFISRQNLGVFLASVTNSIQTVFWTLLNLIADPQAYAACSEAVQKVATKREQGRDWFTLEELDDLVVLESSFLETLRIYQVLFLTREAAENFCLNPKEVEGPKYMVEKGTMIMALPNTMHMDPDIFVNPETFQYDRFLDPNATTKHGTKLSSHLRPFGGGAHMCPGRKLIAYESKAMLAMIFFKYEARIVAGETQPGIDYARQGMSVAVPAQDVQIEVRLRTMQEN